jgi:sterol desaturase/sphingolipid hydroxylase (fatty acid hydroxylase superfamily)
MTDALLDNEPLIRMGCFLFMLIGVALWEVAAPRRDTIISRWLRWSNNLGIVALNSIVVRLIFPTAAIGIAALAESRGWGLFNIIALPPWVAIAASIVFFDFAIYLQHLLFHAVPVLWRFHRMHHADLEFDVTTGSRFHTVEILLSMGIKFLIVVTLGAPAVAVLIFEVLLNATSMFNHGNVRIPTRLDRKLRLFIVTPDMHRVHHSIRPEETNSNFGFNFPWWDRFLGTYRAQPAAGHEHMTIGIERFRTQRDLWLDRMLVQPFLGDANAHPINRNT